MTEIAMCGQCGSPMNMREIAPCIDCGGDPKEVEHLKSGLHSYSKHELFNGETICDFCEADLPSTDPTFWGFPANFKWDEALAMQASEKISQPKTRVFYKLKEPHFSEL